MPKPTHVAQVAIKKGDSYALIRAADFDAEQHELYTGEVSVVTPIRPAPVPEPEEPTVSTRVSVTLTDQVLVKKANGGMARIPKSVYEEDPDAYEVVEDPVAAAADPDAQEEEEKEDADTPGDFSPEEEAALLEALKAKGNKVELAEFALQEFGLELDGEAQRGSAGYLTRNQMEEKILEAARSA